MLAQAFHHRQYNMHMICQACTHIFSTLPYPPTHSHTQPASQSVGGQGHVSPKINSPLFKNCNSVKLIFIISAHGSVARKYLSFICFWTTMRYTVICIHRLYVLGRFSCVCVVIRYASVCFTVLTGAEKMSIQGSEIALC